MVDGTSASGVLHLEIDTGLIDEQLRTLEARLSALPAAVKLATSQSDFSSLSAKLQRENENLRTQLQEITQKFKEFSTTAKSSAASTSASISGVSAKVRVDLKEMGETYAKVTKSITDENLKLARSGVDFSITAKGMKLTALESEGTVKSLQKLILHLEEAKVLLAETKAPENIKKAFGTPVLEMLENIDKYKGKLSEIQQINIDATWVKNVAAQLKEQASLEAESFADRQNIALAGIKARQAAEASYTAWWSAELSKQDRAYQESIVGSVKSMRHLEAAEEASNRKRLQDAASAIKARQAAEASYTAWWVDELGKRDAAFAASQLRTAKQRSNMQVLSVERLERNFMAPAAGTSDLAKFYRSEGAEVGGGSALAAMETRAAAQFREEAAAAATAQVSLSALGGEKVKLKTITNAGTESLKRYSDAQWNAHAAARGLAGSVGQLWLTYGSLVPLLAGAALGSGFLQAAKSGSDFAYQLTFVKALGNEAADSVKQLGDEALKLSRGGLFAPTEIANGLRIMSQAGLSAKDSLGALPKVLDLATVGEMEMADAATTLVGVMNAFNVSVANAGHVGDVFAKAAALSQTSVQQMTEAMKTASVVGEQYGATLEDTAAALTLLAKVNITGTAAGTSLRNMLKELYTPGKDAQKVMESLGLKASDSTGNLRNFADVIFDLKGKLGEFDKASQLNILQRLFGERGAKEAIALLSLTKEKWEELRDSIADSEGFMRGVAEQLEATAKGSFIQAFNTLKADLVEAFQVNEGAFSSLAQQLKTTFDSQEFKSGLNSLVTGMVQLSKTALEAIPVLIRLGEAFIVFKAGKALIDVVTGISAAWTVWATATAPLVLTTTGQVAAGLTALSTAATGSAVAATATGTAISGLSTALIGLRAAAIATGIGALIAAFGYVTYKALTYKSATEELKEATDKYRKSNEELVRTLDNNIEDMRRHNDELRIQLDLMRQGKDATDALALSQRNLTVNKKTEEMDQAFAARDAYREAVRRQEIVVKKSVGKFVFAEENDKLEGYKAAEKWASEMADVAQKTLDELPIRFAQADDIRASDKRYTFEQGLVKRARGLNKDLDELNKARKDAGKTTISLPALDFSDTDTVRLEKAISEREVLLKKYTLSSSTITHETPKSDPLGNAMLKGVESYFNNAVKLADQGYSNLRKIAEAEQKAGLISQSEYDKRMLAYDENQIKANLAMRQAEAEKLKQLADQRNLPAAKREEIKTTLASNDAEIKKLENEIDLRRQLTDIQRQGELNAISREGVKTAQSIQEETDKIYQQIKALESGKDDAELMVAVKEREAAARLSNAAAAYREAEALDRSAPEAEVYARVAENLELEAQKRSELADATEKYGKKLKEQSDTLNQFMVQAARNIQDAFADFLFDPFKDGLDGMLKGFGQAIQKMIAQAVAADLAKRLFGEDFASGRANAQIGGWAKDGLDWLRGLLPAVAAPVASQAFAAGSSLIPATMSVAPKLDSLLPATQSVAPAAFSAANDASFTAAATVLATGIETSGSAAAAAMATGIETSGTAAAAALATGLETSGTAASLAMSTSIETSALGAAQAMFTAINSAGIAAASAIGTAMAASSGAKVAMSLVPSANGNAFAGAGAVQAFAKGGAFGDGEVLTQPTYFRFASGGAFRSGVAGEAGAEGALPLKRMSNGKLGVYADGGGSGGDIHVHMVVPPGTPAEQRVSIAQQGRAAVGALSRMKRYA